MENITLNNNNIVESKKKWINKILTLIILIFSFVSFAIGTICARYMWRVQVVGIDWKPYLNFDLCIPYLVFFLLSLITLIIKLVCFDKKNNKANLNDTKLKLLVILDIVAIVMIVISMCMVPVLLIPVSYDVQVSPWPIITSSLSFILVVSILFLTFYKDR